MPQRKRYIYPLIIILFWCVPFGWFGSIFDAAPQWIVAGLIIGGVFALLGEAINNVLARSLTFVMLLGALLGAVLVYLIIGPILSEQFLSIMPEDGQGVSGIIGLPWLALHAGLGAVGITIGTIGGGVIAFGMGLVGSIIMRVRRGRPRRNST
ncbi:hypothetical protein KFU94_10150 [Chloroflexi bacterium TSY]|nr:hypothetical protein [Chloroflexi bacterium TSY]